MPPVDRDEMHHWIERLERQIQHGFTLTHEKQDKTNGRLMAAEREIAILKDRSDGSGKRMVWTGAGAGAVILGMVELLKWFTGVLRG